MLVVGGKEGFWMFWDGMEKMVKSLGSGNKMIGIFGF